MVILCHVWTFFIGLAKSIQDHHAFDRQNLAPVGMIKALQLM